MQIRPAIAEDLANLHPRAEEAKIIEAVGIEHFYGLLEMGQVLTICDEDKIVAIMGIYKLWSGVYESWVLPSQYITDYSFKYLRIVKQYIDSIKKTYYMHRLQTFSVNDLLHDRWMGFLGFKKEGILTSYTPDGTDYAMWSITNGKPSQH